MKYHGITVQTSEDSKFTLPQVYTNNQWRQVKCYIYTDNEWKLIGAAATQMLWFFDSDGKVVYAGGVPFLVREKYELTTLLDSNENELETSDNLLLQVP